MCALEVPSTHAVAGESFCSARSRWAGVQQTPEHAKFCRVLNFFLHIQPKCRCHPRRANQRMNEARGMRWIRQCGSSLGYLHLHRVQVHVFSAPILARPRTPVILGKDKYLKVMGLGGLSPNADTRVGLVTKFTPNGGQTQTSCRSGSSSEDQDNSKKRQGYRRQDKCKNGLVSLPYRKVWTYYVRQKTRERKHAPLPMNAKKYQNLQNVAYSQSDELQQGNTRSGTWNKSSRKDRNSNNTAGF